MPHVDDGVHLTLIRPTAYPRPDQRAPMEPIRATIPCTDAPAWASWQRRLLADMEGSIEPYTEAYCEPDGSLKWRHDSAHSLDDFYEAFFNWPLLYTIGGRQDLLSRSQHHWEAVTRQLTKFGLVQDEYALKDDQFHQGESDIFWYNLCLADPHNAANVERACRFADLYTGHNPAVDNWDPNGKLIRSAYNGSGGAVLDFYAADHQYRWSAGMSAYGMPYYDIPGVSTATDLKDETNAKAMGAAMARRMTRGDCVANLSVITLVTNAWLLTGEPRYRKWVLDYAEVWTERARANGGLLPDNVGLSGEVGEHMEGNWYGALYGWTWPHGFYNIQQEALLAASCALLMTGDTSWLDMPRTQQDHIFEMGEVRDVGKQHMSLWHHWIGHWRGLERAGHNNSYVVPYRYGDAGWFDWQPLSAIYPVALWNLSMAEGDWRRIEDLRNLEGYDWRGVFSFRNKEDAGHEQPWVRYLAGANPTCPEQMLAASHGELCRRMELIRADGEAATHKDVHRWQHTNPVSTEALVQQTLGAPQSLYNGGLMHARLRYADRDAQRPGLPPDVAALVEGLQGERTVVTLVNLSPFEHRRLTLRGGSFGEHRFGEATWDERSSTYPGASDEYAAEPLTTTTQTRQIHDTHIAVDLPPGTTITLQLDTERYANTASATLPWPQ